MLDITVVILTYNEEIHIRRCLANAFRFAKKVVIIDSYSNDRTLDIAREFTAVEILQHKWENNHAKQFNWGLANAGISTQWVFRLDADEYLSDELISELEEKLPDMPADVTAVSLPLRRVFLGKIMRRGLGKIIIVRLFRYGKAQSEIRCMDEHIQIEEGRIVQFKYEFVDDNLNNLSWWTNKHVGYAVRDAADLLDIELDIFGNNGKDKILVESALKKRKMKQRYAGMPLFWRSFFYFLYRYFLKGGFLDGKEGFLWHFLQGWWFKTLADAKVFEIKRACGTDREKIKKYLREVYNCG